MPEDETQETAQPRQVRLGSASAYTLLAQVFRLGVGFVTSILIARALGPEGKGILTEVQQVPAILAAVFNLGIASANTYFIGTRKHRLAEVMGNSLAIAGVLGAIGVPIVLLFTVGPLAVVESIPLTAAVIACAILPVTLAAQNIAGINMGLGEMKALARTQMAGVVVSLAVIGGAYLVGMLTIPMATAAMLLSALLGLVLNSQRLMRHYTRRLSLKFSTLKESASYSGKAYMSNLAGYLNYRQDLIVLGYLGGSAAVGVYSVAVTFAELMWNAPNALASSLLAKNLQSSAEDADALTLRSARVTAVFMLVICLLAGLIMAPVIRLLFGVEFLPATVPFLLLLPGIWMIGISRVLSANLASKGLLYPWVSFGAMAGNLVLNIVLIPVCIAAFPDLAGGAIGAALSSSVSYTGSSLVTMWLFSRNTGARPRQWFVLTVADARALGASARGYLERRRRRP